jgi:hypothetical protein
MDYLFGLLFGIYSMKYPLKIKDGYVWQSAYSGALNSHYILHSYIWDLLNHYEIIDSGSLYKKYKSYDDAVKDLVRVIKLISNTVLSTLIEIKHSENS